jgi:hypothetical protein
MSGSFDRSRCLNELEGDSWVDLGGETTPLVRRCHSLRTKPIGQFSVEDLRIMIGQQMGLPFVVPIALEVLGRQPLASGDFYTGDLLSNVLRISSDFWRQHPDLHARASEILGTVVQAPEEVAAAARRFYDEAL